MVDDVRSPCYHGVGSYLVCCDSCHGEVAQVVHQVLARVLAAGHPPRRAPSHSDQTPFHLGVRHQMVSPRQAVVLLVRVLPLSVQR